MTFLKTAALTVFLLALAGCAQTHKVVRATTSELEREDYVYYALPRTVITVSAIASVSEVEPSPKCAYGDLLHELGLTPPKIQSGSFLTLHKVSLDKYAEADPGEHYAIEVNGRGDAELGLEMNVRGALTKGSSESTDIVVPMVLGLIETAGSLASLVMAGAGDHAQSEVSKQRAYCEERRDALQAIRRRLLDLDSNAGAADPKEVLEFKAAKLVAQAKGVEALFTGVKPGDPKTIACEVRVTPEGSTYELFTWRADSGTASKGGSGITCDLPPELSIPAEKKAKAAPGENQMAVDLSTNHTVNLVVSGLPGNDLASVPSTSHARQRSFYYRIPAFRSIEVVDTIAGSSSGKRISDRVKLPLPQLGQVLSLPRIRSTGTARVSVQLDPETGALLGMGTKTKEMDFGAAAGRMGGTAKGLIEAARTAETTELERLQQEQAILEARVAIEAAKKALGE